jgi:hypothetical protein
MASALGMIGGRPRHAVGGTGHGRGHDWTDRPLLAKPALSRDRRHCVLTAADSGDDHVRLAHSEDSLESLRSDESRRTLIRLGLNLVPFAGIALLWFIGVVRERLGEIEDRLFSTVFLGSGLLFLAMLFAGAVSASALMEMLAGSNVNADVWAFGRNNAQALISVYALRMAAVFTLSVSTVSLRAGAVPRWVLYLGYLTALVLLWAAAEQTWAQLVFPAWVLLG